MIEQDRQAEVADAVVDPVHRDEHRLGDEVEPAPVDQQLEAVEAELLLVAVDHRDFLGAGEQPRVVRRRAAGRDGLRVAEIVGLIASSASRTASTEKCDLERGLGVGEQRRRPVLVGDAEPGIGRLEAHRLLVVDRAVGNLLQPLVADHADQALVQDVEAFDLRRAVPRDQRIRIKRDRVRAFVGDLVLDGEQVLVVDRNGAAEFKPFAVVERRASPAGRRRACRRLAGARRCCRRAASRAAPEPVVQPNCA